MYPNRVLRRGYVLSALDAPRKRHPVGMRNKRGFPPLSRPRVDGPRQGAQAAAKEVPDPKRPSYAGEAVEGMEALESQLSVRHEGRIVLPGRRPPVRYFSETATGVPPLFLSRLPAPTRWANAGRLFSNHWTRGQRKIRIKGSSQTARPQPASSKPPLRASRRSFRGRDGRPFRKPGARGCRCERASGSWELTGPP